MSYDYLDSGGLYDFQYSDAPITVDSGSVDMTGFYNPSGFETSNNDLTFALQSTDSSPAFNFNNPTSSLSFDLSKGIDYGVKLANTLVDGYGKVVGIQGKVQDQQFNQYLKSAQIDILKTQVGSSSEVAKIKAITDQNVAKIYGNAAGSAANLASLGGTQNSLMLYLTIAGVIFTFIQVIKK